LRLPSSTSGSYFNPKKSYTFTENDSDHRDMNKKLFNVIENTNTTTTNTNNNKIRVEESSQRPIGRTSSNIHPVRQKR
jgi:ribosomal protein S3AE